MVLQLLQTLIETRKNLFLEPAELRVQQWKKLKLLVKHAYENVCFYRKKFDQVKIKPGDLITFEDLARIPITTKTELQNTPVDLITAGNVNIKRCVKTRTSGSTGLPLNLFQDGRATDYGNCLWMRMYERNGLHPWDKVAVIRNPAYFPKKHWFQNFGVMRRRYISALDDANNQIRILKQYRPDAIKSYSSSVSELARILNGQSEQIKPRLIFTGGGLLSPQGRTLVESSFGTNPLDNYGTMEFSLIAWECREHMGYHINEDSVLMEFLDDGQQVASGEKGEVVCTGLINYAMPLIRYKLDDIAVPTNETCTCGVKLPLLKQIEGRENDFLTTTDGRRIPPALFYPYPFENYTGIRQFKIIQDAPNRMLLQLIIENDLFNTSCLDKARGRIQQVFGEDMHVEFEIVDCLEKDKYSKNRPILRRF